MLIATRNKTVHGLSREVKPMRSPSIHPGRYLLLANPFARDVNTDVIARIVERLGLDGRDVLEIGRDGSAGALAAEAARAGIPYLLAAGGDGTIHQIIQEIAGTETALGVIPLGTSNDLAGRLALPDDLDTICHALSNPTVTTVDLLMIGKHRIATVGGFGLPAHVANACNELRAREWLGAAMATLGGAIYSLVAAARIIGSGPTPMKYTVRINHGPPATITAAAILFGLVNNFGGGLRLTPEGNPRPGTFSALAVTASTRAALLATLACLKAGRFDNLNLHTYTDLTSLSVKPNGLVGTFGDGEWLGLHDRTHVKIEKTALKVMVLPRFAASAATRIRLREAV